MPASIRDFRQSGARAQRAVRTRNSDRDARQQKSPHASKRPCRAVESLDEDRILRRFSTPCSRRSAPISSSSTIDGEPKPQISFKFESRTLDDLPLPRPLYEIFVYSPRVEGIHLRFGKVARGGIRWSDRREDFRTEILGLVKAQQVKNAVIVPVGAKGGFVPKRLPAARRARRCRPRASPLQDFISSLLDLTDNIVGGAIVPPRDVVRHDGDDPYLVVAADKGTATFSDIANGISMEHGYLAGRRFRIRRLGRLRPQEDGHHGAGRLGVRQASFPRDRHRHPETPFTVVGVGDMSGDVFGNGMLRAHIKLVAAFDHRDIFIDPAPDPAQASPSASDCSTCRARAGRTMTGR